MQLYSVYLISLTGTALTSAALALLAYQLVGGSASLVLGIALAIRIAGRVFCGPFAGVIADRIGRKLTMTLASVLSAAIVSCFFIVSTVWQIYLFVLLLNIVDALFVPIYKATIPGVVGPKLYPRALASGTIAYELSNIAGPSLAAFVIAVIGFRGNFIIDALTFMGVAFVISKIKFPQSSAKSSERKPRRISYGIRAMFNKQELRHSLWISWRAALVGAYIMVATVDYVKHILHLSDSAYAITMAAFGVGSALGGLGYARLPEAWRRCAIKLALVFIFIGIAIAFLLQGFYWLNLAWFVAGIGYSAYNVYANQLLADHTNEEERVHVYSAQFSLSHIAWGGAYPLAGIAAAYLGFQNGALLFGGLLCLMIIVEKLPVWKNDIC